MKLIYVHFFVAYCNLYDLGQEGHLEIVEFLIEKGAKVDHVNKINATALCIATDVLILFLFFFSLENSKLIQYIITCEIEPKGQSCQALVGEECKRSSWSHHSSSLSLSSMLFFVCI